MLLVSQIYDIAGRRYLTPTYFRDYTDFVRCFIDKELKSDSYLVDYRNDYSLCFLYCYDEENGTFNSLGDNRITLTVDHFINLIYRDEKEKLFNPTHQIVEQLLQCKANFISDNEILPSLK